LIKEKEKSEREALEREKALKDALEKITLAKEEVERKINLERKKEGIFIFKYFFLKKWIFFKNRKIV